MLFFRDQGRFPRDASDLELVDIPALARQLEVTAPTNGAFPVAERTAKRLRSEIRTRYGFREATIADAEALTKWLRDHTAPEAGGEITPTVERLELESTLRDAMFCSGGGKPDDILGLSQGKLLQR